MSIRIKNCRVKEDYKDEYIVSGVLHYEDKDNKRVKFNYSLFLKDNLKNKKEKELTKLLIKQIVKINNINYKKWNALNYSIYQSAKITVKTSNYTISDKKFIPIINNKTILNIKTFH